MWISPWDNAVRGGSQVVSALWGMASGGVLGTGPGLGDPQMIPAGHTDLILGALGEELGFAGIAAVLLLYAALVATGLRIVRRASSDYRFFLALGLTLLTAVHVVLMTAAVMGLAPLTGIGTPFLSYGRSGLLASFAIFGVRRCGWCPWCLPGRRWCCWAAPRLCRCCERTPSRGQEH
jgi:cell division protein FtsW (lipid II flippase)